MNKLINIVLYARLKGKLDLLVPLQTKNCLKEYYLFQPTQEKINLIKIKDCLYINEDKKIIFLDNHFFKCA